MSNDIRAAVREVAAAIFSAADPAVAEFDPTTWQRLAEAGLTLLTVPESLGGGGAGIDVAAAVLVEAGAHAAWVPLAETDLVAGWLLSAAELPLPDGPLVAITGEVELTRHSGGWRLRGTLRDVPWSGVAGGVAVLTDGAVIVLEPGQLDPAALSREPGANLAGEPRDTVVVDADVSAASVREMDTSAIAVELRQREALGRALLLAGALRGALAATVRYAGEREQFGRPIGKFQAVQQAIARAAGEVAAAGSAADAATMQVAHEGFDSDSSRRAIAAAKARTSQAAGPVAATAHQVHGAIGFTQEHRLRLLTTRLWAWRDENGTEAHWVGVLGAHALAAGPEGIWAMLSGVGPRPTET